VLESTQFEAFVSGVLKDRIAVMKAWSFERLA
jgi:hypothetical protein